MYAVITYANPILTLRCQWSLRLVTICIWCSNKSNWFDLVHKQKLFSGNRALQNNFADEIQILGSNIEIQILIENNQFFPFDFLVTCKVTHTTTRAHLRMDTRLLERLRQRLIRWSLAHCTPFQLPQPDGTGVKHYFPLTNT